jgi:ribose 5-phosphate isomerase B
MPEPATPGEAIPIASDHGGFQLKETVKQHLTSLGFQPVDLGCPDESSVNYPDYAHQLAGALASGDYQRGILICGTGIGMSIAANRVSGVRAALCHDAFTARMCREHNDANLLVLGGRVLGVEVALDMVGVWLDTAFGGDRHQRRLDLIESLCRTPAGEPGK